MERLERVVTGAPHMPEMKADIATVTLHRADVRLETAKPRTAQSRCGPLRHDVPEAAFERHELVVSGAPCCPQNIRLGESFPASPARAGCVAAARS